VGDNILGNVKYLVQIRMPHPDRLLVIKTPVVRGNLKVTDLKRFLEKVRITLTKRYEEEILSTVKGSVRLNSGRRQKLRIYDTFPPRIEFDVYPFSLYAVLMHLRYLVYRYLEEHAVRIGDTSYLYVLDTGGLTGFAMLLEEINAVVDRLNRLVERIHSDLVDLLTVYFYEENIVVYGWRPQVPRINPFRPYILPFIPVEGLEETEKIETGVFDVITV